MRVDRIPVNDGTVCPISDALLSRIYRANDLELQTIAMELSVKVRARLAVFCYVRTHLREIGRKIGGLSDIQSLVWAGGHGLVDSLLNAPEERHRAFRENSRPAVTLPSGDHMRGRSAAESLFAEES